MINLLRLCCLTLFFYSQSGFALNCTQLKHMIALYLKMHFKFEHFDDKMSQRTLHNFLRSWDPGKAYLLQKDVDKLTKNYSTALDDQIDRLRRRCAEATIYGVALAFFSASLFCRILDAHICPHFPTGTHFLWHIFNGGCLYYAMKGLSVALTPQGKQQH